MRLQMPFVVECQRFSDGSLPGACIFAEHCLFRVGSAPARAGRSRGGRFPRGRSCRRPRLLVAVAAFGGGTVGSAPGARCRRGCACPPVAVAAADIGAIWRWLAHSLQQCALIGFSLYPTDARAGPRNRSAGSGSTTVRSSSSRPHPAVEQQSARHRPRGGVGKRNPVFDVVLFEHAGGARSTSGRPCRSSSCSPPGAAESTANHEYTSVSFSLTGCHIRIEMNGSIVIAVFDLAASCARSSCWGNT